MIPDGWKRKNLGEVITLQRGFDLPEQDRIHGTIPIISSSGITEFHNESKVSPPGIVTGRYGTIGKVFLVDVDFWPLNTSLWVKDFYGNDHRYVYYLLQSIDYKKLSDKTGVPGINRNDVHKLRVLLPPFLEQCRIAEILGVWDESIDLLEKSIGKCRSRKQGLMQQLLTGKKRFKEFNYSKEDWEKVSFDNCVSSMTSGLSRKLSTQDIGIPVLRSSNIGGKYANFEDLKYWYLEDPQGANTKNYILDDGDILINFINSISQIGKACIFNNCIDRDCIYTTNILRIKPNTRISSDFFYLVTQTEQYRLYVQSITKPAINQASFTTKELKEFTFLLPPILEQEKIAAVLSAADEEISTLEKQLAAYKQEKLGLMQQLLTGKIRVGMI